MSNLNLKGLWIPIEILTDTNLSDKEKHIYSIVIFLFYKVGHLRLISIVKFFKGCHLGNVACARTYLNTLIHTVGEYHLKRTAHIKECGIVPTVSLSRFLRLNATDYIVISRILKGKTSALERGDYNLIVVIGGKSNARSRNLGGTKHKLVGSAVPNSNREGGLRKMYVHCSVHTHIGNIVGYILSAGILTAYYKILEKAVSGKAFSRSGITNFIKVVELNPYTVNKLLSKLSCDNALIQICFIIRIHILVKASGRN